MSPVDAVNVDAVNVQGVTATMRPSRAEFHALAAEHTVVPVWAEVLGDLETPVAAYLKLVGEGEGFLLESVEHAERWARYRDRKSVV